MSNTTTEPVAKPALKALFDHAASTDSPTFCTSWSCYSMCPTQEEDLINEALAEKFNEKEPDIDYLKEVLPLLVDAVVEYRATRQQRENIAKFVAEMFNDLAYCHQRESDTLTQAELDEEEAA